MKGADMWRWIRAKLSKRTHVANHQPVDELGEASLSAEALADIDRLRESKGWAVRPHQTVPCQRKVSFGTTAGMSTNVVRLIARQWQSQRR